MVSGLSGGVLQNRIIASPNRVPFKLFACHFFSKESTYCFVEKIVTGWDFTSFMTRGKIEPINGVKFWETLS